MDGEKITLSFRGQSIDVLVEDFTFLTTLACNSAMDSASIATSEKLNWFDNDEGVREAFENQLSSVRFIQHIVAEGERIENWLREANKHKEM